MTGAVTTRCRCWAVTRRDGVTLGFTDHDAPIAFDGITFRAETGMTARSIEQGTGLAVDNSEALGILSDGALEDADIEAGRYDGARVSFWTVDWTDPTERTQHFFGTIGEITRTGATFRAELRGLTEALNQPLGRSIQSRCSAVLGDTTCRVNLNQPGLSATVAIRDASSETVLALDPISVEDGWFDAGILRVITGAGAGQVGVIKEDRVRDGTRVVTLWQKLAIAAQNGDQIRLEVGCDKRFSTCIKKFDNALNFQGFPDVPGDDWLMTVPDGTEISGGSRRRWTVRP